MQLFEDGTNLHMFNYIV